MLRYPNINARDLVHAIPQLRDVGERILARVDIDGQSFLYLSASLFNFPSLKGQYNAHIFRQEADLRVFMEDESLALDPYMDYTAVVGLSSEVRERLGRARPATIVCPCFHL